VLSQKSHTCHITSFQKTKSHLITCSKCPPPA